MWLELSAAAAAAAALVAVPPAGGVRRLREVPEREPPVWLRGRPGCLSLRLRSYAGAGVAFVVLCVAGPSVVAAAVAALLGVGCVAGLGLLDIGREARRREQLALQLPVALQVLAACMAAGAPIRRATEAVVADCPTEIGEELRQILARNDIGASDADAWRASQHRAVIGPIARDVARAVTSGSALSACLERHAEEARRERRAALETKAKSVGISAVVPMAVCFLPAFVLVGVVPIIAGVALTLLR